MKNIFTGINRGRVDWHKRESHHNTTDGVCAILALALLLVPAIMQGL